MADTTTDEAVKCFGAGGVDVVEDVEEVAMGIAKEGIVTNGAVAAAVSVVVAVDEIATG